MTGDGSSSWNSLSLLHTLTALHRAYDDHVKDTVTSRTNPRYSHRVHVTTMIPQIYGGGKLILEGYSDASFQSDDDDAKSQSGFVFKLNGGVVASKSSKQDTTADSTTETEYIAASEAAKEAVWMKNYIQELGGT
ncbi:UNVERIFIED_CONTAM: Retrovirus-related Pol polyprotein from transposon TNT 1-94 [Sesamum latifolium]|uniref:Retrovirus-related Pol polyprotein from transposon TNT 1-94 n=1 Tax=Sesamum latifolium TaxID=2727402 RepID=A0AAW2WVX9_9LAMI